MGTKAHENDRTALWDAAARAGEFTAGALLRLTGADPLYDAAAGRRRSNALKLLSGLEAAGLVERVGRAGANGEAGSDVVYRLTEAGREAAARWVERGAAPAVVLALAPWYEQVWSSVRILRRFTVPDLMRTLPAGPDRPGYDRVYRYVRRLVERGAVRQTGRLTRNGARGSHASYRLVGDPGPTPPVRYGPQAKGRRAVQVTPKRDASQRRNGHG